MTLAAEKALVARVKKDPQAFGQVFDAHFDAIFNHILGRVANVALAEDLTAQTFFKALKNLWKFRWGGVPISAWLYRIAINEVNDHLRKARLRKSENVETLADRLPDPGHRPDHELIAAEEALAREEEFLSLHASILELKQDEQALVVLRYFENKSFSEIARIFGKREGTLRMQSMRALEKLKAHLFKRGIKYEGPGRQTFKREKTRGARGSIPARPAAGSP